MKLYRFSPIKSEDEFMQVIQYLHDATHKLCVDAIGEHLEVAENVGVFTHYQDEYEYLLALRDKLVDKTVHFNEKYYLLKNPIIMSDGTIYKYLYIRKPDPYRAQVGDIDFVMDSSKFEKLKESISAQPDEYPHARIFPRGDLDMVELHHPDVDVLPYIVTSKMTDKILTNDKAKELS